jgi:hypothetical protein
MNVRIIGYVIALSTIALLPPSQTLVAVTGTQSVPDPTLPHTVAAAAAATSTTRVATTQTTSVGSTAGLSTPPIPARAPPPEPAPAAGPSSGTRSDALPMASDLSEIMVSDLGWASMTNGWGPVERDHSNGEQSGEDGRTLTVNGTTYARGLGVHAPSEVRYALSPGCTTFRAQVGVDDEVGSNGSVIFQVWADGTKLYDSGLMIGTTPTRDVSVDVTGRAQLRLVVTDSGNGFEYDHADWAAARLACGPSGGGGAGAGGPEAYLSDLNWRLMSNGWGPVELDLSNGDNGPKDGRTLTLNGTTYAKGLGVHAPSEVRYGLAGLGCTAFRAQVGVDDEVGSNGSVIFQVWVDGAKLYDSGPMTGTTPTRDVSVDVTGRAELRLAVTDGGNGSEQDHADWAVARLACSAGGGGSPTPTPTPTPGGGRTSLLASCLDGTIEAGRAAAYPLPVSRKAELQSALDTHDAVVLDPGADYATGGVAELRIRSGHRLFGYLQSRVPRMVVEPGTTDAVVSGVTPVTPAVPGDPNPHGTTLTFPASDSVTRGNCFMRLGTPLSFILSANGASLEDNLFLGNTGLIQIDNSGGGYARNNRFIRFTSGQSSQPVISVKGDPSRRSTGNVWLWLNLLTPHGDSLYLDNQQEATVVGVDAEGWNLFDLSTKALFTTGPMGLFRLLGVVAGDNFPAPRTGVLDTAADEVQVVNVITAENGNPTVTWRSRNSRSGFIAHDTDLTNVTLDQATNALRFAAFIPLAAAEATINGQSVASSSPTSTQQDALRAMFVNPATTGTPWERPSFGPISDPAGPNWSANRSSQPDSRAYIQNLVDTQQVARLDPGVYYVSGPIRVGPNRGIVGAGESRTAIIAMNSGVDIIEADGPTSGPAINEPVLLADLTLQGGRNGIYHGYDRGSWIRWNGAYLSHLTLRDMDDSGIFLDRCFGWDNIFVDHLTFANNRTGFKQTALTVEGRGGCYMDKVVFFHVQFVGNGRAVDIHPYRQNTSDAWINALFRDNGTLGEWGASGNTMFANSDFINNGGSPLIQTFDWSYYCVSCYFYAGERGQGALLGNAGTCEGCTFERGSSTSATIAPPGARVHLLNSRSVDVPLGRLANGLLVNTALPWEPSLGQQLVLVKGETGRAILTGPPAPSPRFLRGSSFR